MRCLSPTHCHRVRSFRSTHVSRSCTGEYYQPGDSEKHAPSNIGGSHLGCNAILTKY